MAPLLLYILVTMEYSGGHRGYSIRLRPRRYPRTVQQQRFVGALVACGIRKGVTKKELQDKMVNCLPEYFKQNKE